MPVIDSNPAGTKSVKTHHRAGEWFSLRRLDTGSGWRFQWGGSVGRGRIGGCDGAGRSGAY